MTRPALPEGLDVSRETLARLERLSDLLQRWNPAINLVSRSTLAEAWTRHIVDSAQLYQSGFQHWADLGSGGGFPGLVIATLAAEFDPQARITLVEVDQRKATFLREAARQLGLSPLIRAERIEAMEPLAADILSARALAPLAQLCAHADRHLAKAGTAIFPKGANWQVEVDEARAKWQFDLAVRSSQTESAAVVLVLGNVRHA